MLLLDVSIQRGIAQVFLIAAAALELATLVIILTATTVLGFGVIAADTVIVLVAIGILLRVVFFVGVLLRLIFLLLLLRK